MENDDAFIGFGCPFCETNVDFPAYMGGTAQTCPNCGQTVVVPREEGGEGKPLPIPITTPSLELRRLTDDDWEGLAAYMGDPDGLEYLDTAPMTEPEVTAWVLSSKEEQLTNRGERLHLAMVTRTGGRVVGDVTIWMLDDHHLQASFDLCLNREFRGKGLGAEASRGVLEFCFQDLGLHRVEVECDGRNLAARKLFAKAGMRVEGEFLKSRRRKGEWVDTIRFAMLGEEFGRRVPA